MFSSLLVVEGGLFRPRVEKLMIGTRDRTKLVDGVLKQVEVVRGLLEPETPVRGVLCFIDADWPLIGGSFTTRGVQALWPRKLYGQLQEVGPLTHDAIEAIQVTLARTLKPS